MASANYEILGYEEGRINLRITGEFLSEPIQHSVPVNTVSGNDPQGELEEIVKRIAQREYDHPRKQPDKIPKSGKVTFPAQPQSKP